MTDALDRFLSQPLAEIPDNGFSDRMAALLEVQRLRRERLRTEVYAGLVLLAVMVLPFTPPGQTIASVMFNAKGAALAGVTAGLLFLAWQFKRLAKGHLAV
jgi:hypothetical protein